MRAHDWSKTSLGPVESWPSSLRTAIQVMLESRFPMFVWWGDELLNFYNDAYIPVLGARHPASLGRPAARIWAELWPVLGPQVELVMRESRATWNESVLLVMERYGYPEETYFTFSYSPLRDDGGAVAGVFCACTEETGRVLGQRRLKTVHDIGSEGTARGDTAEQVCHAAAATLAENPNDLPFALVYLLDDGGGQAVLHGHAHLGTHTAASPERVTLGSRDDVWDFAAVVASGASRRIDDVEARFGALPATPWRDDRTRQALVLPLPRAASGEPPAGFLVAGLSPRLPFDGEYRSFLEVTARQLATALSKVRAYQEERKRAEALAELDRAKTIFFSNVSHEFRTPLTLVLGPLRDLLDHPALAESARETLELAHRNAQRLLKLVNTLLDFSRIEAGRIQAAYEPTDLAKFTAELASNFRSAIERAGLALLVRCGPLDEPVFVDRPMWEKVVFNLLSNAFKFTFEGEIEIALGRVDDHVELRVRDTGTGIPAEEQTRVFERFHRVKDARGRTFEGTGIGLALVQELVRMHGGSVHLDSELGRGSTFTVTLPLGCAHLPRDRVQPATATPSGSTTGTAVHEILSWLPAGEGLDTLDQSEPLPAAATTSSRILVADDNTDMQAYLRRLLGGHDVVVVGDGAAALAAIHRQPFDLVLADVMMPHLDGFGLLAALRADPATRTVPVILLSARAGEEARLEGLAAGADDYVVKPFSARELLVRVDAHLQLARVRGEAAVALRESAERFRTMADSAPVMVWVSEPDGSCSFLSRSWYEFTGQSPDDGLGNGWLDAVHRDDRGSAAQAFLAANATRSPVRLEYRLRRHDGTMRWMLDSAAPRFDAEGRFSGYIGSVLDITDRKSSEEALREADRRKDEFLALLAHELRNPLAPIRSATEVLELLGDDDPRQRRARQVIQRQTAHLTKLVDDLLDVSRITRGKVTIARQRLDLTTVIDLAVETAQPLIDGRSHRIEVARPGQPLHVEGDLNRLVQVVGNLLHNAAKYTPQQGHLRLALRRDGRHAVIEIVDDGIGIPAELLPHVFDPFRQADRSLDRSEGGLGIGLTLVRELVALHGGTVEARSDGDGHGSTFSVRLPLLATAESVASSPATAPRTRRENGSGLDVLVVEDNLDSGEMMKMLLEVEGHRVRTAADAQQALAKVQARSPHVVLCDVGLPGMDGYELATRLRQDPALADTTLVAVTGYGHQEARDRARAAGFDHHLVKPVEPTALLALLGSLQATRS